MKRRVAVRAIIVHDNKILAAKLSGYSNKDGKPNKFWCTIGGGVYSCESLEDAIEREVIEETGIPPIVGPLLHVQQFKEDDTEHLEFFFYIKNSSDYLNIDLAKTTHGEEEIAELLFIEPDKENLLPLFLQSADYSNLEKQPTVFHSYL